MRVVLVSLSTLPVMQNYIYNTASCLEQLGVNVHTIGSSTLAAPRELSGRNHVFRVPDTPRPSPASLQAMARGVGEILEDLVSLRPDVVHFATSHSWHFPLARALRQRTTARIVHTLHDPLGHSGDSVRIGVGLYSRAVSRLADTIVVHSEIGARDAARVVARHVTISKVPLGSTKWRAYHEKKKLGKRLLIFGRINRYKGPELVPGISRAIEVLDPEIVITIAGKPSADISGTLLSRIAACSNVELRPEEVPEDELSSYFESADAVLITHTSITQSGVILDAYAHACPIVCFDIPGIREYTPDWIHPVQFADTSAYATRAVEFCHDLKAVQEVGFNVWKYGRDHFSESVMAHELLRVYECTVLSGRPGWERK